MSVIRLHCPHCGTDFIDARPELREGDDIVCPACHTRKTVTAGETLEGRAETALDVPERQRED